MKRILFTAVVLTFLFTLSAAAVSVAEEVEGFRGMKWGTPIAEFMTESTLVMRQNDGKDKFVYYSIADDTLKVKGVDVASIRYFFWKNKFAGVAITTMGESHFNTLKIATEEKLGLGITGIGPSGEEVNTWNGEITQATMFYEKATGKGHLVLLSKMINELKEEIDSEKTNTGVKSDF